MKKSIIAIVMLLCLLLSGCGETAISNVSDSDQVKEQTAETKEPVGEQAASETEQTEDSENISMNQYPEFDFNKKTVTLNSGYEMPILGLGMFSLSDSEAENSTYWALKAGFRLVAGGIRKPCSMIRLLPELQMCMEFRLPRSSSAGICRQGTFVYRDPQMNNIS